MSGNRGEAGIFFEIGITMERLKLGYVEPPRLLYMYSIEVHTNIFLNQTLHHCTHHDTGIYFVKFIDVCLNLRFRLLHEVCTG
jgi:hypothetical protein